MTRASDVDETRPPVSASGRPRARVVLLAGSSGLVGRELLRRLHTRGDTVHVLLRRPGSVPPPAGVHEHVVDFTRLPALPAADDAYCALGTTIQVAGSQAAFRAVDFDAVLAFAQAAKAAGVTRLAVVSALGANAKSSNFYSRVKGEAEAALAELDFERLVIARPSLLAGDRAALGQPERRGETIGLALSRVFGPLIPLGWRPIKASTVARAMVTALAEGPKMGSTRGPRIVASGELQRLGHGA